MTDGPPDDPVGPSNERAVIFGGRYLTFCRVVPMTFILSLIWLPMKRRATIEITAIRARMSAYSARPWPSSADRTRSMIATNIWDGCTVFHLLSGTIGWLPDRATSVAMVNIGWGQRLSIAL